MAKINIYSAKGTKTGTIELPKDYNVEANMNLIAQAMHVYEELSHKGTSKSKTRSQINATGAKMYKQKGTGGARHGDKKAPIFVGGGTAHGPHGLHREVSLSKKLRDRVFRMILTMKASEGRFVLVDKMQGLVKTKEANKLLETIVKDLDLKKPVTVSVASGNDNLVALRSFRNIDGVKVSPWNNINPRNLFSASLFVLDKDAFEKEKRVKKVTNTKSKTSSKTETVNAEVVAPKKETKKPVKKVAKKETKTKKVATKTIKKTNTTKKGGKK